MQHLIGRDAMRILGIVLFIVGFIILYIIGRRKFNRRTITGAERFSSYERSWATRGGEGCFRVVGWFLLISGASAFLLSFK